MKIHENTAMTNAEITVPMSVMHCIQADVIDMRANPSGVYNWILQCKDHLSKFIWLFALQSKEGDQLATNLRSLFFRFGPPRILKTDNSEEFCGDPMKQLMDQFRCTKHDTSRSPHLQAHELIARATAWMDEKEGLGWAEGLEQLEHEINCSWSRTMKGTPFQIMFSREPRDFKQTSIESEGNIHEEESAPATHPAVRGNTGTWLSPLVVGSHPSPVFEVADNKVAVSNWSRCKVTKLLPPRKKSRLSLNDEDGDFDDSVTPGYRHFMSSVRGPTNVHCLCMRECGNSRCACYKNGMKCSIRCHRDHSHVCRNIEAPA